MSALTTSSPLVLVHPRPAPLADAPADAARRPVAEATLRLGGLDCGACALAIGDALRSVAGVHDVTVNAAAPCATVRFDPAITGPSALVEAVMRAGYAAAPDTTANARAMRRTESRALLWRLFVAGFCAMQVMMLATPAYVSAPGALAPDLAALLQRAAWVLTLPVMLFSAGPFFRAAWRSLKARQPAMDVPVALGIGAAFVAGTAATFAPQGGLGRTSYLDSLAMFVAFLLLGRWAEMRLRHRSEQALERSASLLPDEVTTLDEHGAARRHARADLRVGDRLRVAAGEALAADGTVLEGDTDVDEALLSGESSPVARHPGDAVVAGSLNLLAPIVVHVERVGADTRCEAIVALMRAARARRPALLAQADRWATPFTLAVLLLAAGAAAAWRVVDPSRAIEVFVAVLVVTCPCALSLAAPTALLAAAGAMGRRGLLVRRLDAVERLAGFRHLFIDKTGTLTDATLRCVATTAAPGLAAGERARALAMAAALGGQSRHPVARALQGLPHDATGLPALGEVREFAGRGLQAVDAQGALWRLGAPEWALGTRDPLSDGLARDAAGPRAALARAGHGVLLFQLDEHAREGAAHALQALRDDGVALHLVSGDARAATRRLADRLGVDDAHGGCSPEDKLARLEALQAGGAAVAMLGDGVNDAPVLGHAGLAIAMGDGAAVVHAQADAVLLSGKLEDLVAARALARRALRVVRQNLAWAAAYNAACVPLALAGWLPPWAAGLGMAASSAVVVGNAMRLSR